MMQHMHGCSQRVVLIDFCLGVCLFSIQSEGMILNVAAPWMFCSMVMVLCIVKKKKGDFSGEQETCDPMSCCYVFKLSTPKIFAMQHVHMRPMHSVCYGCMLSRPKVFAFICDSHTLLLRLHAVYVEVHASSSVENLCCE